MCRRLDVALAWALRRSSQHGPLDDAELRILNHWLSTVTAVIVVHIYYLRRVDDNVAKLMRVNGTVMTNETPVHIERDSTNRTILNIMCKM